MSVWSDGVCCIKKKTAYVIGLSLVGWDMCMRERVTVGQVVRGVTVMSGGCVVTVGPGVRSVTVGSGVCVVTVVPGLRRGRVGTGVCRLKWGTGRVM